MFKRGKSGNPRGRPKADLSVRALAREHTVEAVQTLVAIMRDKRAKAQARARAAEAFYLAAGADPRPA